MQELQQGSERPEQGCTQSQAGRLPAMVSQRSTVGVSQLEIELPARHQAPQPAGGPGDGGRAGHRQWDVSQLGVSQLEITAEGDTECPGLTASSGRPPSFQIPQSGCWWRI